MTAAGSSTRGDRAIGSRSEDLLGRAPFAEAIARQIASTDPEEDVVFGIVGSWGSGKTSLLNMIEEVLEEDHDGEVVLRINPWLFSGAEHLVGVFFEELGAQLLEKPGERLKKVGQALEKYGEVLGVLRAVPVAGPWAAATETGSRFFGRLLYRRNEEPVSLRGRRHRLEEALSGLDERVVVMVDDLDRLRLQEIRDVVALVRLNADLPNITFTLAYDRRRVEEALAGVEGDGRAYLEKIVQAVHDVPEGREVDLSRALLEAINGVIDRALVELGPFDENHFWSAFHSNMRPLVNTVRDVRRYEAALRHRGAGRDPLGLVGGLARLRYDRGGS